MKLLALYLALQGTTNYFPRQLTPFILPAPIYEIKHLIFWSMQYISQTFDTYFNHFFIFLWDIKIFKKTVLISPFYYFNC